MTSENLERTLMPLGIRVVGASDRVIKMRHFPTGPGFSKNPISVMLMRQAADQPFLAMLVDADLRYHGTDSKVISMFSEASCRDNWRILTLRGSAVDPVTAIKLTLKLLGNDQSAADPDEPTPLSRYGVSPALLHPFDVYGRDQELLTATSLLMTESPRLLLISGDAGVGKSALVSAIAKRLAPRGWTFAAIDLPDVLARAPSDSAREDLIARLLEDAAGRAAFVLVLEQINWLMALPLSTGLLSGACVPIVGTVPRIHASWFQQHVRHTSLVELHGLDAQTSLAVLESRRAQLEAHHQIIILPECVKTAVERSVPMAGPLPGKAITLLDLACARATLEEAPEVGAIHVLLAASDLDLVSAK